MNKADLLDVWSAAGFDSPDAAGKRGASRTQLRLAMDAYSVSGSITQAVDAGHLREVTATDRHHTVQTVGYRLSLGGSQ
jgi:hypothetical protein